MGGFFSCLNYPLRDLRLREIAAFSYIDSIPLTYSFHCFTGFSPQGIYSCRKPLPVPLWILFPYSTQSLRGFLPLLDLLPYIIYSFAPFVPLFLGFGNRRFFPYSIPFPYSILSPTRLSLTKGFTYCTGII